MQKHYSITTPIRCLAGIALLSLVCTATQAATNSRGNRPKPKPIRTEEYRPSSACPSGDCGEFFGPLIRGGGKGG